VADGWKGVAQLFAALAACGAVYVLIVRRGTLVDAVVVGLMFGCLVVGIGALVLAIDAVSRRKGR